MSEQEHGCDEGTGAGRPRAARAEWAVGLVVSAVLCWTAHARDLDARDLAWGLWLSSLTAGVVFFFAMLARSPNSPFRDPEIKTRRAAFGVGLVLFVLFCIVHGLIHQALFVFLSVFLPFGASVKELAADADAGSRLFAELYAAYWPIVLLTLSCWGLGSWLRGTRRIRTGELILPVPTGSLVRLVLVVFVLAGLQAAGLGAFAYYPVLVVLYLPVERLLARQ